MPDLLIPPDLTGERRRPALKPELSKKRLYVSQKDIIK